ncbi:unnamed protein product [Allacma fusca]|uniref:Uncharacterized protein n=1 Tax=Allacma fusca TaxID=39272 RepID=A0A8J2JNH1_9HEXA|nr:unnamed protein product [Allacma fusca]
MIQARWYKKEQTDKKIIISNVPPHVPHDIIIKQMATHDVIPTSQMRFLHISQEEELKNVLSERRSVFIPIESESKLPPSEMITYDEEEYRVFYNNAQVKCFICHQLGHTTATCDFAKKDDNKIAEKTKINPELDSSSSDVKITEQNIENAGLTTTQIHDNQVEHMDLDPIQNAAKRPLSTSTQLSEEVLNQPNITTEEKDKQDKKRIRFEPETEHLEPISIKQLLAPIEDNFKENSADYPISFSNFGLLMDMVKGQKDPCQSVLQFTADFKGVIKILQDNYSYLSHRSMKTRFTKLQNKLKNLTSNEPPTTEQDQQLSDENS